MIAVCDVLLTARHMCRNCSLVLNVCRHNMQINTGVAFDGVESMPIKCCHHQMKHQHSICMLYQHLSKVRLHCISSFVVSHVEHTVHLWEQIKGVCLCSMLLTQTDRHKVLQGVAGLPFLSSLLLTLSLIKDAIVMLCCALL